MEENNNQNTSPINTQATPMPQNPPLQNPSPSTPPVAPTTPPPAQPVNIPTNTPEGKSKGLLIVAVILIVLIVILGILYYIIIKQSYTTSDYNIKNASTADQITPPQISPTVTPTDEEFLNSKLEDPTQDINALDQDAKSL